MGHSSSKKQKTFSRIYSADQTCSFSSPEVTQQTTFKRDIIPFIHAANLPVKKSIEKQERTTNAE
jgi:hypothetical protein